MICVPRKGKFRRLTSRNAKTVPCDYVRPSRAACSLNTFPSLVVLQALHLPQTKMGLSMSSLFSSIASLVRWSKEQDVRILMLGLDSAGKTTILYRLQVRRHFSCGDIR